MGKGIHLMTRRGLLAVWAFEAAWGSASIGALLLLGRFTGWASVLGLFCLASPKASLEAGSPPLTR